MGADRLRRRRRPRLPRRDPPLLRDRAPVPRRADDCVGQRRSPSSPRLAFGAQLARVAAGRAARWCSPTGRRGPTTSRWASSRASRPSCGTSIIPERSHDLHRRFVDAGADIILTNTFGCNRNRLSAAPRRGPGVRAGQGGGRRSPATVADAADRPVVVAGSVGPTGELFAPLGALTHDDAVAAFREQIEGLVAGGADVAWIETMSAPEEVRAAATAAIDVGVPYTATCSFDTAGRTMMGLLPGDLGRVFDGPAGCTVGLRRQLRRGRSGHPRLAAGDDRARPGGDDDLQGQLRRAPLRGHRDRLLRHAGADGVATPRWRSMPARASSAAAAARRRSTSRRCGAAIDRAHDRPAVPTSTTIVADVGPLANAAPGARRARVGRSRRERREPV